tara:strand:+ start:764 stop:1822 length:1059 start_codon:yes stop_codon:yes gene_type:complete
MATADISTEIVAITGVTAHDASDEFIVSAQKSVVASIPKELLPWAMAYHPVSVNGSAIAIENDSIVEVTRTGYSCKQIPFSESIWANDPNSLKKATNKHPVYWIQDDGVKIAPATDADNSGYAYYVNYAEIDDASDLRSAVVYRACSTEFTKLAIGKEVTTFPTIVWTVPSVPIASPTSAQTIEDFENVPTFTPPVMGNLDFADTDVLIDGGDPEMLQARIQEIQAKIGEFSANLSEVTSRFNLDNSIFQADVQKKIQEAQLKDAQEAKILQKFQGDVSAYQVEVNTVIQSNQSEIAEWNTKNTLNLQQAAFYTAESKKYYDWALQEVANYVKNNSTMLDKTMAVQAQQQRG